MVVKKNTDYKIFWRVCESTSNMADSTVVGLRGGIGLILCTHFFNAFSVVHISM